MRILVTGSRDWQDEKAVRGALLDAARLSVTVPVVVHGGARGADVMAARAALEWGWETEGHLVTREDWTRYGRGAGPRRNVEMVRAGADVCLAFIRDHSPGAVHCADTARVAGIPVRLFTEGEG